MNQLEKILPKARREAMRALRETPTGDLIAAINQRLDDLGDSLNKFLDSRPSDSAETSRFLRASQDLAIGFQNRALAGLDAPPMATWRVVCKSPRHPPLASLIWIEGRGVIPMRYRPVRLEVDAESMLGEVGEKNSREWLMAVILRYDTLPRSDIRVPSLQWLWGPSWSRTVVRQRPAGDAIPIVRFACPTCDYRHGEWHDRVWRADYPPLNAVVGDLFSRGYSGDIPLAGLERAVQLREGSSRAR